MPPSSRQFSLQKNEGPPLRTNQMRETWVANSVTREGWYSTMVSVHDRFDLYCAKHELPASWGQYTVDICTPEYGRDMNRKAWLFKCFIKGRGHHEDVPLTFLKIALEKPASPENGYICLPSDPNGRLELKEGGRVPVCISFASCPLVIDT